MDARLVRVVGVHHGLLMKSTQKGVRWGSDAKSSEAKRETSCCLNIPYIAHGLISPVAWFASGAMGVREGQTHPG